MKFRRPDLLRIGLALGGGAVLGAAHVGVIRAFEESDIELHCISGTSIGALVASLHAFGKGSSEIEKMARKLKLFDITRVSLSRFGLLSNEKLADLIHEAIGEVNIEDAPIPLAIVATDVAAGEKVVFRSGPVAEAVMASSCVPGIFTPVEIGDRMLVDGGLMENVPVSPLKDMGAFTKIGVDLNANRTYARPDDLFDVLANGIDIAIDYSSKLQSAEADFVIAPDVAQHSRTDPSAVGELIDAGYSTAVSVLRDRMYFTLF